MYGEYKNWKEYFSYALVDTFKFAVYACVLATIGYFLIYGLAKDFATHIQSICSEIKVQETSQVTPNMLPFKP